MTTSGVIAVHRSGGFVGLLLLAAVVLLTAVSAGPAGASTAPEQSKVYYSNGGRIMSVNPDGTARRTLTRKGKISGADFGLFAPSRDFDRWPRVSPDGSRVMFFRQSDFGDMDSDFFASGETMVVPASGGKPRKLFGKSGDRFFFDAAWIPGSRNFLVAWHRRPFGRSAVAVVDRRGKVKRVVLEMKAKGGFSRSRGLGDYFIPTQLSVSPDGRKFLMTRQDGWVNSGSNLELVDLGTGKRRLVRRDARQGRWSADGSRIVFVASGAGPENCADGGSCRDPYDVFTASAKGKNVKRVKATTYDELWPSFSPDGQSVVFTANKNRPSIDESRELYRMSLDGKCLDWLTNGTPSSREPDWAPGTVPELACGTSDRRAFIEGRPGPLDIPEWGPRFWLGERYGGDLISSSLSFLGISLIDYRDCAEFRRADCPKPVMVAQLPVCLAGPLFPVALQLLNSPKIKLKRGKARGVRFRTGYAGGFGFSLTYTGKSVVAMMRKSGGVRSGRIDQLRLIRALRTIKGRKTARLPVFRYPRSALRSSRMVKRSVRRHGIRKTAKRLDISRWEIRANLRLRANLRKVGPAKPAACRTRKGFSDFFGVDSVSASSRAARALEHPAVKVIERNLPSAEVIERNLPAIEIPEQIKRSFLP